MPGMTTAAGISGSLDASNIVSKVLQKSVEFSKISNVMTSVLVPELVGTIPISTGGSISEDVEELQRSDIEGGEFTNVDFSLKKDRVKLAISDESKYKSKAGDPLTLQIAGAAQQLEAILAKKTVAALETSPQTGSASKQWSTVTNSILYDLATAVDAILPYEADFVVMPKAVHTAYLQNDTLETLSTGNPAVLKGAKGRVPGLDLDIFVDENCTAKSCTVGASQFCGAIGRGPVDVRKWDDGDMGAKVYQMDVFRQAKAPVFSNSSSLNMAAYKITSVIA